MEIIERAYKTPDGKAFASPRAALKHELFCMIALRMGAFGPTEAVFAEWLSNSIEDVVDVYHGYMAELLLRNEADYE